MMRSSVSDRDGRADTGTAGGSLCLRAPAKLNLGLRLLGVRPDGYHLIESLFAPIQLWDEVEVEIRPGPRELALEVEITSDSGLPPSLALIPSGSENLVWRAAAGFCAAYDVRAQIRVRLRKRIPAAAGLGGGSSDAAAVLEALARLTGQGNGPGDRAALAKLAGGLGADVPFFLQPEPALVTGIGEQIEPVADLPGLDVVVANPGISLATAEVYRAADALGSALTPSGPGSTMHALSRLRASEELAQDRNQGRNQGRARDWREALGDLLVNDLEPAARRLCPPVGRLLTELRGLGAVAASMTGSGATVFGVFDSASEAEAAAAGMSGTAHPGEPIVPAGVEAGEARPGEAPLGRGRSGRGGRGGEGGEGGEDRTRRKQATGSTRFGEEVPSRRPPPKGGVRWVRATRLGRPSLDSRVVSRG